MHGIPILYIYIHISTGIVTDKNVLVYKYCPLNWFWRFRVVLDYNNQNTTSNSPYRLHLFE
ncbi:hypothetical protein QTP88_010653 [Uroleucon formosanum]